MKTTTFTCDSCGVRELKIEADVCGWQCFAEWLRRQTSVADLPLFAGAAPGGN